MSDSSGSTICGTRLRLMDEASRYREQALLDGGAKAFAGWDCDRGHRWDSSLDVAQNVRCLNCASERRTLETKRLHEVAEVRGGRLLSRRYVDAATPLSWQCAYGHMWDARPDVVSRYWCGECARTLFACIR
ncbi:hypothetical protein AWB76_03580 [Caballeronia temeraria]|uniref:Uncharacterized protein n=1 Tax=Caballeronia temeraria TaxID=1777137 RepID=A0A158B450_9BURK|nr:hypothetical protein [Caballeronia temeraria]SAK64911.1 hypothetical protein AWB76_03580 [Caballeronia temeraria]